MTNTSGAADFYEDDEAVEDVVAAFEAGIQGETQPPRESVPGLQVLNAPNFRTFWPGLAVGNLMNEKARLGELVQA